MKHIVKKNVANEISRTNSTRHWMKRCHPFLRLQKPAAFLGTSPQLQWSPYCRLHQFPGVMEFVDPLDPQGTLLCPRHDPRRGGWRILVGAMTTTKNHNSIPRSPPLSVPLASLSRQPCCSVSPRKDPTSRVLSQPLSDDKVRPFAHTPMCGWTRFHDRTIVTSALISVSGGDVTALLWWMNHWIGVLCGKNQSFLFGRGRCVVLIHIRLRDAIVD